jgi:hypothetical protein
VNQKKSSPSPPPALRSAKLNAELERIIEDLSRLRDRVEALDIEQTQVRHDLTNHLTLASVAALRLRFMPNDTSPLGDS